MKGNLLFPDAGSKYATGVDHLYFYELCVAAFFVVLIATLICVFAIKFRRRPGNEVAQKADSGFLLEIAWTVIPLGICMTMFVWGTRLLMAGSTPPPDAMQINVVGRQWMWKLQHPEGRREINELHLPAGRPVRLLMTSEDVIHSFYVPAFRLKQDVLPGRYTSLYFDSPEPGEYHLFCAEYCGTLHSGMIGKVIVMRPSEYEQWLAGAIEEEAPATAGEKLFTRLNCALCHSSRAPTMSGLYGSKVTLKDGATVDADENYLRESILNPSAKIVAGYEPIMPSFRGQLSEEQLMQLVAYIKSQKEPRKDAGVPP